MLSKKEKQGIAIILGVVGLGLGVTLYQSFGSHSNVLEVTPLDTLTPTINASVEESTLWIHVSGAVRTPGVYSVKKGSRALLAIQSAGGFAPNADLDKVNLAQKIKDGQRVLVPYLKQSTKKPAPTKTALTPNKLSINQASAEELASLPHIGAKTARAIVTYRAEHGPFQSLQDLEHVKGIGKKARQMSLYLDL